MTEISNSTIEAIRNEYRDICEMITPNVKIKRLKPNPGSLCLWEFTVNAPTYYLTSGLDIIPKKTNSIVFYLDILNGFPKVKPHVYYNSSKILASVNVFTSGSQCIDNWHYDPENAGKSSSLEGTVRKTLMDIIHDPSVTRFESMANGSLESWQRRMYSSGKLPSCSINDVIRPDGYVRQGMIRPDLPLRNSATRANRIPPAMPVRR